MEKLLKNKLVAAAHIVPTQKSWLSKLIILQTMTYDKTYSLLKKEAPVTLDDDGTADDPSKVPVLARSMSWGKMCRRQLRVGIASRPLLATGQHG